MSLSTLVAFQDQFKDDQFSFQTCPGPFWWPFTILPPRLSYGLCTDCKSDDYSLLLVARIKTKLKCHLRGGALLPWQHFILVHCCCLVRKLNNEHCIIYIWYTLYIRDNVFVFMQANFNNWSETMWGNKKYFTNLLCCNCGIVGSPNLCVLQ